MKRLFERVNVNEAYWISPRGKILQMGDSTHIAEIIKNPEAFGQTEKDLHELYDSYGEEYGSEGKARESIIKSLFRQGWIRARRYTRPDRWTVNAFKLNNKTKDGIAYWAGEMSKTNLFKFDDVFIDIDKMVLKQYTMSNLAKDCLYMESGNRIPDTRYKFKMVESVYEL